MLIVFMHEISPNIFRVFMLDIHKTPSHHYINTTITDGIVSKSDDQHNWIRQHRLNTTVSFDFSLLCLGNCKAWLISCTPFKKSTLE